MRTFHTSTTGIGRVGDMRRPTDLTVGSAFKRLCDPQRAMFRAARVYRTVSGVLSAADRSACSAQSLFPKMAKA